MKLYKKKTNKELRIGDEVSFHGKKWIIRRLEPPHKPDSSGRVYISPKYSREMSQGYYATVFGSEFRGDK